MSGIDELRAMTTGDQEDCICDSILGDDCVCLDDGCGPCWRRARQRIAAIADAIEREFANGGE